ncbi:MAG TPA: GMP synthase (glutamine-hydrolyzing), partial [Leptolyngbya sp.]|nr:GMP synthase (glutamine-hydrolyzing) [Leptolyngbya sp.]
MTPPIEPSVMDAMTASPSQGIDALDRQMIVILDFGSQYSELIARRIRETQVYSEVLSYRTSVEQLQQLNPKGI